MDLEEGIRLEANRKVGERCKHDLFYLAKYVLGGGDLIDPKVHGPLCASMRHLLFKGNPEESLKYEYPSDWGRTEEEGMPNEVQKAVFREWQQKFEPNLDAAYVVRDKIDITLTSHLYLMPRGTLKTSVITIAGTIQWLMKFPEDRVAIDSETITKAQGFLTEIKGHFEENEKLRDIWFALYGHYPDRDSKKKKWSTEGLVIATRKKTRKEPSVDALGPGVARNGWHYDIAFLDDLHSELNTKTKERIDEVKEHRKLVYSLLDPNAPQVVVGTRWTFADMYQEIIEEEFEDFNFITRTAQAADGSLFYPIRLDERELKKKRRLQGAYLFSCQYMNNPVDDETATFKRSDFRYVSRQAMHEKKINWYGLVDPSFEGPYSDYCAIVIAGFDSAGNIYVKHVVREKMTYKGIIDKMFELEAIFHPVRWGMEVVGTQKSIEYELRQQEQERARSLRCHLFKGQRKAKEERIRGLAPYFESNRVYFMTGLPNLAHLIDELVKFPRAKNDDVSDCLANLLEIGVKAAKGLNEEQRRTSVNTPEYIKMLNKPRSPMVGY